MSTPNSGTSSASPLRRAAQIIVVGSVAFTFISYWKTAAIVLCDMSSTVYYIGAIVETAIGKAAPWFILAVLLFSYAMRSVYIESSALFVRGGVYRVVKDAMGGFLAKLSVSALMFDYILTGPISGVSAGQYVVGLILEALGRYAGVQVDDGTRHSIKSWGSVLIACCITLYFFRQNLLGIPESSDKALKIMIATVVMGAIMLGWCGVTLATKGPTNKLPPLAPDLHKKVETDKEGNTVARISPVTGEQEDPLGFIGKAPAVADPLRSPSNWLSIIGFVGIMLAFGHSILAMSGEETLAQVYREVESPKLPNFKKAAFLVFIVSLLLTGTMNFLAVVMIPDDLRMKEYYDNWMGGLTMQLVGPIEARLLLNAFVVMVGFLILSGAVNTSIIGSNGVLSRVAEDGVLPDWFLKPHARYGTNARILVLIMILQLITIVASRGDVILLGEAYAFGIVWSFTFKTVSMVVLRFKDRTPRPYRVPFNFRIGKFELPIGLGFVALIVLLSAVSNLFTKMAATVSGIAFTLVFLVVFMATERYYERRRRGAKHEHLEQFNRQVIDDVSSITSDFVKPHRKLVAIRSPNNLFMLEKSLAETDPDTTDVVVMTAKVLPAGGEKVLGAADLDTYDQHLMTAVVERAERAGKPVTPLILPTNSPLNAVLQTARDLKAQEVVMGASNKYATDVQLEEIQFNWVVVNAGNTPPLSVRILGRDRDVYLDIAGGCRIPKISERQARSVAELRAAGVGVNRVLMYHDGTTAGSDLFRAVLTMLDPQVGLDLAIRPATSSDSSPIIPQDLLQAEQLDRHIGEQPLAGDLGPTLVELCNSGGYDLLVLAAPAPGAENGAYATQVEFVQKNTRKPLFLAKMPEIPTEAAAE